VSPTARPPSACRNYPSCISLQTLITCSRSQTLALS
jgi:hypothetical protein